MAETRYNVYAKPEAAKFIDNHLKLRGISATQLFIGLLVERFGLPFEWLSSRKPEGTFKDVGLSFEEYNKRAIDEYEREVIEREKARKRNDR